MGRDICYIDPIKQLIDSLAYINNITQSVFFVWQITDNFLIYFIM